MSNTNEYRLSDYGKHHATLPIETHQISYPVESHSGASGHSELQELLGQGIFIPASALYASINSLRPSGRLRAGLLKRRINLLRDLNGVSYRKIFLTRNGGEKTVMELWGLMAKLEDHLAPGSSAASTSPSAIGGDDVERSLESSASTMAEIFEDFVWESYDSLDRFRPSGPASTDGPLEFETTYNSCIVDY